MVYFILLFYGTTEMRKFMKRHLFAAIAGATLLGLATGHAQDAVLGDKEFYTQVNIWFEAAKGAPKPIPTTHYHVGEQIPVGSKVTVTSSNAKEIKFSYNGQNLTIQLMPKHTTVKMDAVKDRMFKKTNPLESEAFTSLTKEQQAAVKAGQVKEGMTKEAVLMSYGYPPEHKTLSTTANFWTYWHNKFTTRTVTFDADGKVSETKGF